MVAGLLNPEPTEQTVSLASLPIQGFVDPSP